MIETPVSPDILKACDIRGVYPKPLGTTQAEQVGLAVGTVIKAEAHRNIKVVVGRDVRHSSDALSKALIQGLRGTGLKIVDAGLVSTPLLAYATRVSGASVGVMVTASHNPPDYNGFKFFTQGDPAPISWINRLYEVLQSGSFKRGAGIVEKKNFYPDYRNALVNSIAQNFQGIKLVVDFGNGAAALTAMGVLESLNCLVDPMNEDPDGDYPGRGADSSSPAALEALGERVKKVKARLGVSFDGDGDRVSFVDEKGREVPNDIVLCLFAADYAKKYKNLKVVYDGKCSDLVERTVQASGAAALLERSGHSFIFNRMKRDKALLGGEASGHFFLPGIFPGDALFACLKLLEILKAGTESFSQFYDRFPKRFSTHDLKLSLPGEEVQRLYESLKARAQDMGAKVFTVDGVRAVFEDGWGIARMSVTEHVLSCRLEASSPKAVRALVGDWFRDSPDVRDHLLKSIR
jgi:phosphomannomutase/phosphoglucomutase